MSNTVANQTWAMINDVNASLRAQQRTRKEGSERIAQANSSKQSVYELQQIEKDVILPADPQARQTAVARNGAKAGSGSNKPQLPSPKNNWNGWLNEDADQPGLISILGTVLALQAKTNSNFWSTLWQQASQSMMMEVKFAPIIGNAINGAYQAQSAATANQADQSWQEGVSSMITFALSVGVSTYADVKDPENPLNQDKDDIDNVDETAKNPSANTPSSLANDEDIEMDDLDEESKTAQQQNANTQQKAEADETREEKFSERGKRYLNNTKSAWELGQKRFVSILGRGMQTAQMFMMASDGITKFFITSPHQAKQALYQSQEGGLQAISKEAEQYAQFYGQDFSREEDLRQGAGQNIDYGMNILKSSADNITQTVNSMFRG